MESEGIHLQQICPGENKIINVTMNKNDTLRKMDIHGERASEVMAEGQRKYFFVINCFKTQLFKESTNNVVCAYSGGINEMSGNNKK